MPCSMFSRQWWWPSKKSNWASTLTAGQRGRWEWRGSHGSGHEQSRAEQSKLRLQASIKTLLLQQAWR